MLSDKRTLKLTNAMAGMSSMVSSPSLGVSDGTKRPLTT